MWHVTFHYLLHILYINVSMFAFSGFNCSVNYNRLKSLDGSTAIYFLIAHGYYVFAERTKTFLGSVRRKKTRDSLGQWFSTFFSFQQILIAREIKLTSMFLCFFPVFFLTHFLSLSFSFSILSFYSFSFYRFFSGITIPKLLFLKIISNLIGDASFSQSHFQQSIQQF